MFMAMCGVGMAWGDETLSVALAADDGGAIPQMVKMEDYDTLVANSPFTRTLGISDSLILTGVARFERDTFATLLDTKTMESHVVSRTANHQGWQLVSVDGDPDVIQTWRARIQVPGGEIVSIRYQKPPKPTPKVAGRSNGSGGSSGGNAPPLSSSQLDEAKKAAVNYKEGFNADGYPKQPPREMVEKLSHLSTSQREDINRQMFGLRNQGLGLDERRKIYEGLVDRAVRRR